VAKNVVFRIKSVPAFYLPIMYYPIRDDQRSTGFLLPHLGYSSVKGLRVRGRLLLGHGPPLRPRPSTPTTTRRSAGASGTSSATPRSRLFPRDLPHLRDPARRGGDLDYDIDWNAFQMLPGKVRATLNVRQFSDLLFQQQYPRQLQPRHHRSRRAALTLQRSFGSNLVVLTTDSMQTLTSATR
jgi:hypothetical protein